MCTTACYAANVQDVVTVQVYQMAYRTLLLRYFNKKSILNSGVLSSNCYSKAISIYYHPSRCCVYCTCVITDICMYTCRLIPVQHSESTGTNAHKMYIYTHNHYIPTHEHITHHYVHAEWTLSSFYCEPGGA